MKSRRRPLAVLLSLALSLALFGPAGCGKSSTTPPPDPGAQDPTVFPSTPDNVMKNFKVAYETMSPATFAHAMHPQSMMILQQSTRITFPDVGATLDHTELTDIVERMFSKQDFADPLGSLVPGVQTIAFQTFQRVSDWTVSLPGDVIPNTESALYSANVVLGRGQIFSILHVTGNIRFYVSHRDSTVADLTRPYYQVVGQVDLTNDVPPVSAAAKGIESSSWGAVHAMFR